MTTNIILEAVMFQYLQSSIIPMSFDRNSFTAGTHQEVKKAQQKMMRALSVGDRLRAMWQLTCQLYRIDPKNPPAFDRTAFSMRKHNDNE